MEDNSKIKECGIIMPIAAMPGYTSEHWSEVKQIIIESTKIVEGIEFKTSIVSDSDGEIDVIHKRIVQNIYNADIVVCDISGKNPNVMFELGMRLTFDKPTIIIKDDDTDFIFDTGVIEHITYPKDLRFSKVVHFKEDLARRIKATYEKAQSTPDFSTFLGNFGQFKVPSLDQTTVTDVNQYILEELGFLRHEFSAFKKEVAVTKRSPSLNSRGMMQLELIKLQELTEEYILGTGNINSPDIYMKNHEFVKHLDMNGIEVDKIPETSFLNAIKKARNNVMHHFEK
ncbi:MAG: RNA helicase [Bacillota bacterium]